MNILVIYHDADLVTHKMLASIAEDDGFNVTVAAPADKRSAIEGKCRWAEIPPLKSKITFASIRALRKIMRQEKTDVVFSPSTSGLSNGLLASWGLKVKNIGYRGTQAKVRRTDPTYYLGLLNPRVCHIVCETPDIKEYLSKYIPAHKLSGMPKPYEPEWVADAVAHPETNRDVPDGAFKIAYIGVTKGRPHKGLKYLIEAMHLLERENVHLTVIGNAEESDIASAGRNVTFTGNRPDAVHFLPTHDIFVLPSTRDASPRVVREAQACGLPCIVTDIPGARDLIIDKVTGMLIPPRDAEAIARAVRQLMDNRAETARMGKAARQHIADDFRMDSYVEYFKNLFRSCL